MTFEANNLYYIYNRSYSPAFLFPSNYLYFIDKITKLGRFCDLLAYCITPTQFDLLVTFTENSPGLVRQCSHANPTGMQTFSRKIGTLQSAYAQGFNKQQKRSGSLFLPRAKSETLNTKHAYFCFHYIHQNPLRAGLVSKLETWRFSSFNEYFAQVAGCCNKEIAYSRLHIEPKATSFYRQSYEVVRNSF